MSDVELDALLSRTAAVIGRRLDEVFRRVELVRRRVADIAERAAERQRRPDRAALTALRPLLQELLSEEEPVLEGIGVAVGTDTLADTPRWLEWWRRDPSGRSHFIRHTLTPDAVGFYDYHSREWFRQPISLQRAIAVGPYVDAGGIEACTVTLAMPLTWASGGDSVVGADLSMPALEALLLRTLATRQRSVVLLAANDRVVVSNTARHVTGARFRLSSGEGISSTVTVPSSDAERLPWRLVGLSESGRLTAATDRNDTG